MVQSQDGTGRYFDVELVHGPCIRRELYKTGIALLQNTEFLIPWSGSCNGSFRTGELSRRRAGDVLWIKNVVFAIAL